MADTLRQRVRDAKAAYERVRTEREPSLERAELFLAYEALAQELNQRAAANPKLRSDGHSQSGIKELDDLWNRIVPQYMQLDPVTRPDGSIIDCSHYLVYQTHVCFPMMLANLSQFGIDPEQLASVARINGRALIAANVVRAIYALLVDTAIHDPVTFAKALPEFILQAEETAACDS
jgi:hypothetical protein